MMCPSGMRMPSGLIAGFLLTHGLFDFKKCPDVPESAAARLSTYLCVIVFVVAMMFILLSTNLSHTFRHLSQLFLHLSAHRIVSGCFSHVALFLESAGGAVVTFFHLETMAPEVAVFFHACHVDGSSGDCGGAVGSSSSLGNF